MRRRACSSSSPVIRRENAPSVGNGPGATAFSRIPYAAHSTASERVMATTPALAAADGSTNAEPVSAYVVATERTSPFCLRLMTSISASR